MEILETAKSYLNKYNESVSNFKKICEQIKGSDPQTLTEEDINSFSYGYGRVCNSYKSVEYLLTEYRKELEKNENLIATKYRLVPEAREELGIDQYKEAISELEEALKQQEEVESLYSSLHDMTDEAERVSNEKQRQEMGEKIKRKKELVRRIIEEPRAPEAQGVLFMTIDTLDTRKQHSNPERESHRTRCI